MLKCVNSIHEGRISKVNGQNSERLEIIINVLTKAEEEISSKKDSNGIHCCNCKFWIEHMKKRRLTTRTFAHPLYCTVDELPPDFIVLGLTTQLRLGPFM